MSKVWQHFRQDFDDFDVANEDDVLEEFLGILRKDAAGAVPTSTTTAEQPKEPKTEQPIVDKLG